MSPSSSRDAELQGHLRKMKRILAQLDQHALEHDLYEPINEILQQIARMVGSPDCDISVHPQAMFFMKAESHEDDATTDTSSALNTSLSSGEGTETESSVASVGSDHASEAGTQPASPSHTEEQPRPQEVRTDDHVKKVHDPTRYPDFVTRLSFRHAHRRILFVHEVKRFPSKYTFTLGPKSKLKHPQLAAAFREAREQIVEQVQLAFERYPLEDEIRAMCIIGLLFQVFVYKRESMPGFDEYSEDCAGACFVNSYGPAHIFNQRLTGYNSAFKSEWQDAAAAKLKAIKACLKKGEKGTVVANPLIKYDFEADK